MHKNRGLLILVLMVLLAFTSEVASSQVSTTQKAQSQLAKDRNLSALSFRHRVIEIFNFKANGKEISSGQTFTPDEEWAKTLTFDVRNASEKVATHLSFSLIFRQPDGKSFALLFSHGRSTWYPEVKPTTRVTPGEVIHAAYYDKPGGGFRLMNGPIGTPGRNEGTLRMGQSVLELAIGTVIFEDDTMWKPGPMDGFYRRNPLSPTSWIPIGGVPVEPPKPPVLTLPITKDSTVSVAPQADELLSIFLKDVFARDWIVQINFGVENKGTKPVRLISIRRDEETSAGKLSGLLGDNAAWIGWTMKPGQFGHLSYTYHPTEGKTLKQLILSVDYVEFTDGTTWGPDAFKSAERVAGCRAGAEAERELLLKVLTEGGVTAVLRDLDAGLPERVVPSGHTPEWEQNFTLGVKNFRTRLQRLQSEEGTAAVENLLRNPFDIMTGR